MAAFYRDLKAGTVALIACAIVFGTLLTWWMVVRSDRELRAVLLQQTQLLAKALNVEDIKALTGTDADVTRIEYRRLKDQLADIRSANPQCRFLYLMGRKADGAIIFYVDSEPVGSKDYSPPGQVFEEASPCLRNVFATRSSAVEGPITDRWGTWVSALVALTDPQTEVVLGMDLDASDWRLLLASEVALPVGLMLLLLIGMVSASVAAYRVGSSPPKQVMRRLLPPLASMMILLLAGAFALLWWQQHQQLDRDSTTELSEISFVLRVVLEQQASGLTAVAQPIAADPRVQKALRENDAESLLATWQPVFEAMHRESHITHFYFIDASRTCLLRVHTPEKRGDRIDRFTALESERTGKTASGIELGPQGTFTLRVVQPVFARGTLVGYVELGMEIEEALQAVAARSGDQVVMTIHKDVLGRPAWEESMHRLGRKAEWDSLLKSVVVYSSLGHLPNAFVPRADSEPGAPPQFKAGELIRFDGKDWRPATMPMREVSGNEVGTLLVIHDVTPETLAFSRLLLLGGISATVLLALLLGFVYVLLRRTDMDLLAQQAALKESEQRFKDVLYASQDAILLLDDKAFVDCNDATVKMLGYTNKQQFSSVHPAKLSPPFQPDGSNSIEKADEMMGTALEKGYHRFEWVHRKATGEDFPVEVSLTSVVIEGKNVLHCVWRDITEHKRRESAMKKRMALDVCLSQMIHSLLRGMKSGDGFVEALAILGRGNKASRTCLFQNYRQKDGSLFLRMVDQWSEQPINFDPGEMPKPGILYPAGWDEIRKSLARGDCYCGDIRRWGEEERKQPWLQDFKTFLFTPIYVELQTGYRFWGFLSFIQNDVFREWDENDIEIAKSAADLLGAFLTRCEEVEQLHLLGAGIDSAEEAFIITDANLEAPGPNILFANPAMEKLSGYRQDELLGRSPRVFQGPQTNREALRRLKEDLPKGIPFHGVTTNYRKDGSPYLVDWNIAPVRTRDGQITHYVSVQRDITRQDAMVKRLALASKMESVGALAAGIAHEINSPAQFIGDNVQYAYDALTKARARLEEAGISLEPKVARPLFEKAPLALHEALEGLARIDKIVLSMREFAHPGEEFGPSDINRCLETSVPVCRNEWKHFARVEFDLDPNLPPVPCVRSDINQVVVNLVVNAAQAIAEQNRGELGRVLLSTRVSDGWAELRVEDDGPGIPQEIVEKIFAPFFTTKPVGQGTGQGLFLAQQCIVNKHHGVISVGNLPDGGASFLIQLPLDPYPKQSS